MRSNNLNSNVYQVSSVMILTLVSKVLGFARDIILANYFGASSITDAFLVAQTIPESLFSIVVQTISIGFIPIYTELKKEGGLEKADIFTNKIIEIGFFIASLFIIIINLFPEFIISIFASGFETETLAMTIKFVRIASLILPCKVIVATFTAYLNSHGNFKIPAMKGIVLDIVMITSIFLAFYLNSEILVWGIVIAAIMDILLMYPFVRKAKTKTKIFFKLKDFFDTDVKKMVAIVLPLLIGVGVTQINVIVDRTMASSVYGGVSSLDYANKVNNVLENIIILSLSTVIYPLFSKNIVSNDYESLEKNVTSSLDFVSFTMIPAGFICFLFSSPIISLLFGRGAFDKNAIEQVSKCMACYSIGLFFLSQYAVLTRVAYSFKKVLTVSLISICILCLNIVMNFLLKPIMGISGLALSTSVAEICGTIILLKIINRLIKRDFIKKIFSEGLKSFFASTVSFIPSFFIYSTIQESLHYVLSLIISLIIGGVMYLIICFIIKSNCAVKGLKIFKGLFKAK